jgi:hypothetical protein
MEMFLVALVERKYAGMLPLMADGAVLTHEGNAYRGDALSAWMASFFPDRKLLVQPVNAATHGANSVVTVIVSVAAGGADDEAGSFQMDWKMTLSGSKILALDIGPATTLRLPAVILTYIRAMNSFDLDQLLDTFADDALVNDQLRDYWGKPAIAEWAAREIIGDRMTMAVVKIVEHYGSVIITANVDGDYDKRGLPEPLVLAFCFSALGDKIVQLIILRNIVDI